MVSISEVIKIYRIYIMIFNIYRYVTLLSKQKVHELITHKIIVRQYKIKCYNYYLSSKTKQDFPKYIMHMKIYVLTIFAQLSDLL
jgi:hypothetical protein